MKLVTVAVLTGMLSLSVAGISKAGQNELLGAANDSYSAAQSGNLESASYLSGKFLSGSATLPVAPVVADFSGPKDSKAQEQLVMSESKKVKLEGDVPPPTPPTEVKGDFNKPGFLHSLTEAVLSPILTPVDGVISGGTFGSEFGKARAGKAGGVIGAILGGIVGLAVGLVVGVVKTVINVVKAFIHLFNGRL